MGSGNDSVKTATFDGKERVILNDSQGKWVENPREFKPESANMRQVGGEHYKGVIQHWDYAISQEMPYLEGQITKYITRWRKKNGLQDLQKAKHFLDKLIECVESGIIKDPTVKPPQTMFEENLKRAMGDQAPAFLASTI